MRKLRSLFSGPARKRETQALYIALVRQSRKAFFYEACAVPDTLDGRFDIIVLHVFLGLQQLRADALPQEDTVSAALPTRLLLECLFNDLDRSLREMGVGDMGVGKHIKTMSKAAFGRLDAYEQSMGSDAALAEALVRNVYRGKPPSAIALADLVRYVRNYALPKAVA